MRFIIYNIVLIMILCGTAFSQAFVTPTGQKYHSFESCPVLKRAKKAIRLDMQDAIQKYHTACNLCEKKSSKKNNYPAVTGYCTKVSDGDTITVSVGQKKVKVRLYGIDAPEKRQAFGGKAKKFLQKKLLHKKVILQILDKDRYGRVVALVRLASSHSSTAQGAQGAQGAQVAQVQNRTIQDEIIKNGLAWVYPRYCKLELCTQWEDLQLAAKEESKGLWREHATEPWQWRKMQRHLSLAPITN